MDTVPLGQTSLRTSRLAYGCWRVTGQCELPDHAAEHASQGRAGILAALETGYTLFDNADVYGNGEAERLFGKVLKEVAGMRERIRIVTKAGVRKAGSPATDDPYRYDSSSGHIIWSCEQSLKRLGIETIDVYLIHRPDYLCDLEQLGEAFVRLRQAGKVREFGVSNFAPHQVASFQKVCSMPFAVHQVEISLERRDRFHDGTLDQCASLRISPMAWSPLAAGRLATADPIPLDDPDHARRLGVRETLDQIARDHNTTRPVVALAWLLKHPANIIPIVGSTNPARLKASAAAADIHLSREEWYRLMEAAVGQRLP